jgi:FkbM family methyltransferase
MNNNKKYWTLSPEGNEVLRDLIEEHKNFNHQTYTSGECDGNNFMYYEMFEMDLYDSNGCDYERYGCYIKEGDVVVDLGANIGLFSDRAEQRGASQIYSFEPITPTFNCLIKNKGPKTNVYKMAVGSKNEFKKFKIHTDYTHIGGGTSDDTNSVIGSRNIIHEEIVYTINVNELFNDLIGKIDFMKVDIEGGEVEVLNSITDQNLKSLRCLACEFHKTYEEFDIFQKEFGDRMTKLGFRSFTLYHGDGNLRTVNFWKE